MKSLPILVLFFTLSTLSSPTFSSNLNSDKQALLDFANSISHSKRLNWNASTQVCSSWTGIACDPNRARVVSIRLPGIGLFGKIPPNTISKLDGLKVLSLRSNLLSGNIPSDIPSIPSLRYLFLQHNNLSNELPPSFSEQLVVLDLSFNSISGEIPASIRNLTRLAKLKLQSNLISGNIPNLNNPRLKLLNLSYNNLNGSVPNSLRNHPYSSFLGNSKLCGRPLKPCLAMQSSSSSSSPPPKLYAKPKKNLGTDSIIAIVIGCAAILFLVSLVIFICCLKRRGSEQGIGAMATTKDKASSEKPNNKDFGSGVHDAEKNKLFFFPGCDYSFDLEDLLRASAEILGKGNNGTTYKAVLDEGSTTVVVKRLTGVLAGKKEFEQLMEGVARVGQDHPNVMTLKAYYYSKDEKLLVYDYMPSGSLFEHLHGFRGAERTPLNWETRVKIALGAARGISHIHSSAVSLIGGGGTGTSKSTIHGNIKSSNILLTQDLDARVADLGLSAITNPPHPAITRAMGYRAPETVLEPRKPTQKSDVYSFGVMVLEMLTGKVPIRHPGVQHQDEVVDLPRWVRSVVREEWTAEVFDVEMLRQRHVEEEMVQMLQIGLVCAARAAESRPSMQEVVKMLEDVAKCSSRPSSSAASDYSNVQTP